MRQQQRLHLFVSAYQRVIIRTLLERLKHHYWITSPRIVCTTSSCVFDSHMRHPVVLLPHIKSRSSSSQSNAVPLDNLCAKTLTDYSRAWLDWVTVLLQTETSQSQTQDNRLACRVDQIRRLVHACSRRHMCLARLCQHHSFAQAIMVSCLLCLPCVDTMRSLASITALCRPAQSLVCRVLLV